MLGANADDLFDDPRHWHPVAGFGIAAATWAVLGGRNLRSIGSAVAAGLADGGPESARGVLPSLCGRDRQSLHAGVVRDTVEPVAENTSDSVVAPLFWGAVAGLPGLVGYRAVNTRDAMVGHRSPRFARLGTAAARLDDAANVVPVRLTAALTLAGAVADHTDTDAIERLITEGIPAGPSFIAPEANGGRA